MLDPASLERLSRTPERNDPLLNVALAEEGGLKVLTYLARSVAVGAEALEIIEQRLREERVHLAKDADLSESDELFLELDQAILLHPHASERVRDVILERHLGEAFFTLTAACHPRASLRAIELAVDWPAESDAHDRLWLPLINPARIPPLVMEEWSQHGSALRREAVARIAEEGALLKRLRHDPCRKVRRALASNRFAQELREELSTKDSAPEVRARARGSISQHNERETETTNITDTARFAAALRAMESGGVLSPDVVRALSKCPSELDPEGGMLAGMVLPRKDLVALVERVFQENKDLLVERALSGGIGLRPSESRYCDTGIDLEADLTELVYETSKVLSRALQSEGMLTGKARVSSWVSRGLASLVLAPEKLLSFLAAGSVASNRMIFARFAEQNPETARALCLVEHCNNIPMALVEHAWKTSAISDKQVIALAGRVLPPKRRSMDLPDDELDLDPSARPLEVLERCALSANARTSLSPRTALTVVALDARRVRYVLAAMPQWKGRISGANLGRVLRQHSGALTVAAAESRARGARVEAWTERVMNEIEFSIALAVGHLTGAEVARRIQNGRQPVHDGVTLAAGVDARAALEGVGAVTPILEWAKQKRTSLPSALSLWLLLEKLDRERPASLIASAVDSLASTVSGVLANVCEALAIVEQRSPGRLDLVFPQSPRGRATLVSAIARAYRTIGGLRNERPTED